MMTKKQIDLLQLKSNYDSSKIQMMIDNYTKHKLPKGIIDFAKSRVTRLSKLNMTIDGLTRDSHGYIHGEYFHEFIIEAARDLSLMQHPYIRRVRILRRLPELPSCVAAIAGAVGCGAATVAATLTTQLRAAYCEELLKTTESHLFTIYDNWRAPADFFYGSVVIPLSAMKERMLVYSPGTIPTSLTKLPPQLCALAVWIFSRYVCCIERNLSSHPELLLRDLINLGRSCVSMRDEIFAQHLKMIRGHPDEACKIRLFASLLGCLEHFPPSEKFESYMQAVLMIEVRSEGECSFDAKLALRILHESIFNYGYGTKITCQYDDSLETMKNWISSHEFLLKKAVENIHRVNTNFLVPIVIRGTKQNWISRFQILSKGRENIDLTNFTANLFDFDIDSKDKEIFLLLISGKWPTRRLALTREYDADKALYQYDSSELELISSTRRKHLLSICNPPVSSVFEDRNSACKIFWRTYMHAFQPDGVKEENGVSMAFEDYRDIILSGMQWIKLNGKDLIAKGAQVSAARDLVKELI
jgi:hypothetical protein